MTRLGTGFMLATPVIGIVPGHEFVYSLPLTFLSGFDILHMRNGASREYRYSFVLYPPLSDKAARMSVIHTDDFEFMFRFEPLVFEVDR
jgi:hypothetical protein